ncbi:hypothetical protein MTR_3g032720 [Medicago truncatula]|uniref:Uncharacterized protein n=1 Tax=Medicago truncatula TaxID=3880 RepID=G7J0S7_MEDTR|nr:hypothetical protein MTR_3g032720 [Medicago truncatula]
MISHIGAASGAPLCASYAQPWKVSGSKRGSNIRVFKADDFHPPLVLSRTCYDAGGGRRMVGEDIVNKNLI